MFLTFLIVAILHGTSQGSSPKLQPTVSPLPPAQPVQTVCLQACAEPSIQ